MSVLTALTVRVVVQDADADRQRRRDALEVTAGRIAIDIERRLQEVDAQLSRGEGVRLSPDGPVVTAGAPLLYRPELGPALGRSAAVFRDAEFLEFQRGDLPAAAAAYRRLTESADVDVSAGAWLRLGRVFRNQGDAAGALEAYRALEDLGAAAVEDLPAALAAALARGRMFEAADDRDQLASVATDLSGLLQQGGWAIDRATLADLSGAAERWGGPPVDAGALARTDALIDLWTASRRGALPLAGRQLGTRRAEALLVVWATTPDGVFAVAMTSSEVDALLRPLWESRQLVVAAFGVDGHALFGERATDDETLLPTETGLPFVLSVAPGSRASAGADWQRRLGLPVALGLAFVLMGAAAVGLYRTTTRELNLAREQADFVSAVSHEFRTPLTSMRHITDLLTSRGVTDDARRTHFYGLLADETERLHRMVETLLTFGRVEAGAHAWRFESASVSDLLDTIATEFRREPSERDRDLVIDVEAGLPDIAVDREAMSRAIWNLLENAAKYSDPAAPVVVSARRTARGVSIDVRDRGPGIAPDERERIFRKFVRGRSATQSGARGVGIGLALVKTIVEAHGGTIGVTSELGVGSTFRIELPEARTASAGYVGSSRRALGGHEVES